MSNKRGKRRSRPPNLVEWIDESPPKIMRNAWLRTMSNNRGKGRGRPPNLVEWIDESPAKIVRNAWLRTRKAVSDDHQRFRRIWRIRNEWLSKGERCRGKIPSGAFRRQK